MLARDVEGALVGGEASLGKIGGGSVQPETSGNTEPASNVDVPPPVSLLKLAMQEIAEDLAEDPWSQWDSVEAERALSNSATTDRLEIQLKFGFRC